MDIEKLFDDRWHFWQAVWPLARVRLGELPTAAYLLSYPIVRHLVDREFTVTYDVHELVLAIYWPAEMLLIHPGVYRSVYLLVATTVSRAFR